jgi:hypothetical protein
MVSITQLFAFAAIWKQPDSVLSWPERAGGGADADIRHRVFDRTLLPQIGGPSSEEKRNSYYLPVFLPGFWQT